MNQYAKYFCLAYSQYPVNIGYYCISFLSQSLASEFLRQVFSSIHLYNTDHRCSWNCFLNECATQRTLKNVQGINKCKHVGPELELQSSYQPCLLLHSPESCEVAWQSSKRVSLDFSIQVHGSHHLLMYETSSSFYSIYWLIYTSSTSSPILGSFWHFLPFIHSTNMTLECTTCQK